VLEPEHFGTGGELVRNWWEFIVRWFGASAVQVRYWYGMVPLAVLIDTSRSLDGGQAEIEDSVEELIKAM
jgi:hypothetical protein